MSDTRPYPKILRTTVDADRDLRAYAAEYEIKPFEALVVAIDRLRDPVESEGLQASLDKATATTESLTTAHDALLAETERIRARELVRVGELAAERVASERFRADLESAREATRRADAEVERLTRELAEARAALATKGATDRLAERVETIAAALPDELDQRVRACIAARPNAVPPRDFAFVVKNGCDRIEGSDRYQDKIKAENAARRAEREADNA